MSQEHHLDLRGVEIPGAPFSRRAAAPSLRMESRLSPGCHAVVVQSEEQADALILTCAGLQKALRGRPKIAGKNPFASPSTRADIVCLLSNELSLDELGDRTVEELISQLCATGPLASREPGKPFSAGEQYARLKHKSYALLDNTDRRALMLELAFSHPKPQLALLYEPWTVVSDSDYPEMRLLGEIRRLVRQGCIIVLLSVSERQAERYSSRIIHPSLQYTRSTLLRKGRGK